MLAQQQAGVERVIAYVSRSLHLSERNASNYSPFRLELLAIKWVLCEKFKDYLWGAKVTVITDNNPLVHLKTARLGAVEQRLVAQLANFDYHIHYRSGRDHTNADVVSRLPASNDAELTFGPEPVGNPPLLKEEELLVGTIEVPGTEDDSPPPSWGWNPDCWQELQREDPSLTALQAYLERGMLPLAVERRTQSHLVWKLLGQWDRLSLKEGVICRSVQDPLTHETKLSDSCAQRSG